MGALVIISFGCYPSLGKKEENELLWDGDQCETDPTLKSIVNTSDLQPGDTVLRIWTMRVHRVAFQYLLP